MAIKDRREEIMRVVERLLAGRRFHELTLDEVAEAAQVGKGTIYRYFSDKDDLFFQTATAGFDELCAILRRPIADLASFEARLETCCQQVVRFFQRRRQLMQLMQDEEARIHWFRPRIRQRWLEKRRSLVDALAGILAEGVADGSLAPAPSPRAQSTLLLGLLRAWVRELSAEGDEHLPLGEVVRFFLRAAASRDPAKAPPPPARAPRAGSGAARRAA